MEIWIFILVPIIVCVLFFAVSRYLKKSQNQAVIANIKHNRGVLTSWQYTPAEWRYAAEEYFKISTQTDDSGRVSFTPQYVFISNGKKDILWEIVGDNKYEKHLTDIFLHKSSPMNFIKFEVKKKVIRKDQDDNETERCSSEEFYVPIPSDFQTETDKVMKFYENILDTNADAVAAVMPYGLGMFGR